MHCNCTTGGIGTCCHNNMCRNSIAKQNSTTQGKHTWEPKPECKKTVQKLAKSIPSQRTTCSIIWQGNTISAVKTFASKNCALWPKERIAILKQSRSNKQLLVTSNNEMCVWTQTTFPQASAAKQTTPSTDESINDKRANPTHEVWSDFAACNVCPDDVQLEALWRPTKKKHFPIVSRALVWKTILTICCKSVILCCSVWIQWNVALHWSRSACSICANEAAKTKKQICLSGFAAFHLVVRDIFLVCFFQGPIWSVCLHWGSSGLFGDVVLWGQCEWFKFLNDSFSRFIFVSLACLKDMTCCISVLVICRKWWNIHVTSIAANGPFRHVASALSWDSIACNWAEQTKKQSFRQTMIVWRHKQQSLHLVQTTKIGHEPWCQSRVMKMNLSNFSQTKQCLISSKNNGGNWKCDNVRTISCQDLKLCLLQDHSLSNTARRQILVCERACTFLHFKCFLMSITCCWELVQEDKHTANASGLFCCGLNTAHLIANDSA
mgnify:CR=1 FL=1